MELSLFNLFDDFPLRVVSNGNPRRRNATPIMRRFLDFMEEDMDQKVGYIYRRLPDALHVLMKEFDKREKSSSSKKRKADDSLTSYEPKSKVKLLQKDDKFQIALDTSHYQPEEITVKVIKDQLAISAKHESKNDDCYEFHEMYRCFSLPDGVDPDTITSRLDASGQLTVEAPMKAIQDSQNERTVPVVKMSDDKAIENSESPTKA
ncbi:protein lethal(2)essential for life [Parasteatoda tepidariorum]|uniref:protein lethal(2)essential for life n=1 Tax=Parasteatoda tepidariorum TaxID=114398 RepID=UPI001C720AD4|nr:protein lethal(2)essential for life [Parasteatoda tepidariorum]